LKLSAACGGESLILKEQYVIIRSLTSQQAAWNALDTEFRNMDKHTGIQEVS
jgi:hypothetical protein